MILVTAIRKILADTFQGLRNAFFFAHMLMETVTSGSGVSYRCTLCDCEITDLNSRALHVKGRRHRLAYKQKYDPEMFVEMQPSKRLKSCLLAAKKRISRKEAKTSRLDSEFKVLLILPCCRTYFFVLKNKFI